MMMIFTYIYREKKKEWQQQKKVAYSPNRSEATIDTDWWT
jgi:hypothetical protein